MDEDAGTAPTDKLDVGLGLGRRKKKVCGGAKADLLCEEFGELGGGAGLDATVGGAGLDATAGKAGSTMLRGGVQVGG
jgi:hypothetical protein